MAEVFKFKVKLIEMEDVIWRDIEISSLNSVVKLGYSILAAFEAQASHLFSIKYSGNKYEIMIEGMDDFGNEPAIDPIATKLRTLCLSVGDVLTLEYDYGAGWEFLIELLSITEMKKGAGTHYPYITDGNGKGIIEDTSPHELVLIKETTDKSGIGTKIFDVYSNKEILWDYREFDLKYANYFLKDEIYKIQSAYEMYE